MPRPGGDHKREEHEWSETTITKMPDERHRIRQVVLSARARACTWCFRDASAFVSVQLQLVHLVSKDRRIARLELSALYSFEEQSNELSESISCTPVARVTPAHE